MKYRLYRHLLFAFTTGAASLLPVWPALGQTTNIIDGFASNYPGTYYVGETNSGNGLIITNGGSLADVSGWIGSSSTANSNRALVTGSPSLWTNSDWIILGDFGSYNELRIENGGRVQNKRAVIGMNSSGISNTLVVTGSGSFMDILGTGAEDFLYLGYYGPRNRIEIRNGGRLGVYFARLGEYASAVSNTVLVTGAGSVWSNSYLYLGYSAAINEMRIEDGGQLRSTGNSFIGVEFGAAGNSAIVRGAGSVLSNAQYMGVGYGSPFNQLRVEDGGEVYNGSNCVIGWQASSLSNSILVTGTNSILRIGGKFYVGYGGSGGCVMNDSGQVRVNGDVIVTTNSCITNYVQRFSGGLDMTSVASSLIMTGAMSIVFQRDPGSVGHFWGFRKAGDYTVALSNLHNTGKISWSDSALSPFWRNKVSIYYDQTNSYIGFYVSQLLSYTLITVR